MSDDGTIVIVESVRIFVPGKAWKHFSTMVGLIESLGNEGGTILPHPATYTSVIAATKFALLLEEHPQDESGSWMTLFFSVMDVPSLLQLAECSDYLGFSFLIDRVVDHLAGIIRDTRSPDQIRCMFMLEDDQTEEEKQEIARQLPWLIGT